LGLRLAGAVCVRGVRDAAEGDEAAREDHLRQLQGQPAQPQRQVAEARPLGPRVHRRDGQHHPAGGGGEGVRVPQAAGGLPQARGRFAGEEPRGAEAARKKEGVTGRRPRGFASRGGGPPGPPPRDERTMDEQRFIDEVFADPDSHEARLVYADWLEEHGQEDRAALIRAEIDYENSHGYSSELYGRQQELKRLCTEALGGSRRGASVDRDCGLATATIRGDGTTDANLRELGRFPFLKTMLSFEYLTPDRLEKLSLCPNVQRLEFEDHQDLTTKHWQALKKQTQIERLGLSGGGETERIANAHLPHVAAMHQLRELDLRGTAVSDAGVAGLSSLSELEVLKLDRTHVGDAGVEFLPSLTKLRVLSLRQTRVTDATLQRLLALKRL